MELNNVKKVEESVGNDNKYQVSVRYGKEELRQCVLRAIRQMLEIQTQREAE